MVQQLDGLLWCLAYGLGLLVTALPGSLGLKFGVILALGICLTVLWPGRSLVYRWSWGLAAVIMALALVYLPWRSPRPTAQDVSVLTQPLRNQPSDQPKDQTSEPPLTLGGHLRTAPQLSSSGDRIRFQLAVDWFDPGEQRQEAQGCVYVTVPLLQARGLQPGQRVTVVGRAYEPQPAQAPQGFDFQQYLARQGCFLGMVGDAVIDKGDRPWGWWWVRRRVIQAQVTALGSPGGMVVSAMVLGNRAVDLPNRVREAFAQVGLAHTIAASGFHVSLLLACVLSITQGRSSRTQCLSGLLALGVFLGLTGFQPSILRAVLMGAGGLLGLALDRKTNPLSLLLLVATLLLLYNPLWIWDLGFQLSFLATFGLLVTTAPLMTWLEWLPPRLAELLAIPLAAILWTSPILLYQFGFVCPYGLLVNPITTPLIVILSLGGMVSGLGAILFQPLGIALAWPLQYPLALLLGIVDRVLQWPGANMALGRLDAVQLVGLYGLFLLIWRSPRGLTPPRKFALILGVMVTVGLQNYAQQQRTQLTLLPPTKPAVLLLRDHGQTALLNSGGESTVRYLLLPWLRQQGINRLTWAVQTDTSARSRDGWLRLWQTLPVTTFYTLETPPGEAKPWEQWSQNALQEALVHQGATAQPLTPKATLSLGSWQVVPLDPAGQLWQLHTGTWTGFMLLDSTPHNQQALLRHWQGEQQAASANHGPWLLWPGNSLMPELLEMPWAKAIVLGHNPDPTVLKALEDRSIPITLSQEDGLQGWFLDTKTP